MSIVAYRHVWHLSLPARLKLTALAFADFADERGRRVWPSVGRIARMTGKSRRQTHVDILALVHLGVLVVERKGLGGPPTATTCYRFDFTPAAHVTPAVGVTPAMDCMGGIDAGAIAEPQECLSPLQFSAPTPDVERRRPVLPTAPDPSREIHQERSTKRSRTSARDAEHSEFPASEHPESTSIHHREALAPGRDGNRPQLAALAASMLADGSLPVRGDEDKAAVLVASEAGRRGIAVSHLTEEGLCSIVGLARVRHAKGFQPDYDRGRR